MLKVGITGHLGSEGIRKFDILKREKVEEMIKKLDTFDIYRRTLEKALGYGHSGTAYTYIDVRDGEIITAWISQGTMLHPWDAFYEIWLCSIDTGGENIDFNDPEYLLDTSDSEEMEKFYSSGLDAEDFIREEFSQKELDKRYENLYDCLAQEFVLNDDFIQDQLDHLYS